MLSRNALTTVDFESLRLPNLATLSLFANNISVGSNSLADFNQFLKQVNLMSP